MLGAPSLTTIYDIHLTDNMVDPSGLGHRMKMKCIFPDCGFEKEVDNGILLMDTQMLHKTRTGHDGWTYEHL
jgi:hypothetical protein